MAFALCYILYSPLAKENGKQVAARWIYAAANQISVLLLIRPLRGISSAGRAIGSQSIGQGFESPILHKNLVLI